MFFVRNFISLATVRNGSICMGAFGSGGVLKIVCAADTAAVQLEWVRRREGW